MFGNPKDKNSTSQEKFTKKPCYNKKNYKFATSILGD
jgi:hypothetical protein